MKIYTDSEIAQLLSESKKLPSDYLSKVALKPKANAAHKERELRLTGENGNRFCLKIRVSTKNYLAFSVVLCLDVPLTNKVLVLCRYDGKYHEHANRVEKDKPFYDFHVHRLTERYQLQDGIEDDGYAVADKRYQDCTEALKCLFIDCGFIYPADANIELFD